MDDRMDPMDPGDEELRRRLDAYADARLRPDARAAARTRVVVMARARAVGAARVRRPTPFRRRPLVALLAATVALVALGAGTVAASAPGGALYGVRLWLEVATLPSDPAARVEAQLQRIEARLAEIEAAAAAGDRGALAAALAAYDAIVGETVDTLPTASRDAHLETVLARHLEVLGSLLATAPEQALDGLRNAIEKSTRAIERIDRMPAASPKPGGSPDASPAGGGKPSPKPDASPAGSGKPSPKPDASPAGGGKPSPKPDASAKSSGSTKP